MVPEEGASAGDGDLQRRQQRRRDHRARRGSVDRVADSLKSEFKTKRGRKVFDGGGLDPDVSTADEYLSPVAVALVSSGLVFDYASKYSIDHPDQPNLNSFRLSDGDYKKFLDFLQEQKFTYTTSTERYATKLIETARKERYHGELESQLNMLKNKIDVLKVSDISKFKNEIQQILEEQIAFHYALTEGQAAVSLNRDKTILEARKVLTNLDTYNNILTPADGQNLKP